MKKATTYRELAENINNDVDEFEINIDLRNKVVQFKAKTNKISGVLWGIAFGAITAAVILIIATPAATATTAGVGGAVSFGSGAALAGGAVTILGFSATSCAVALGVAAGGVGAITKLKDKYDLIERDGKYIMRHK